MTTNLKTVSLSLAVGWALVFQASAAGEFWNEKPASAWSEKEIQRLLTKSPWAKEVNAQMNFPAGGQNGGGPPAEGGPPGGRGMGGPGGRGFGGPQGGLEGPGSVAGPDGPGGQFPEIKAVVRWESAAPMREASKRELAQDASECYVIGVSGLPFGRGGRGAGPGPVPVGDGGAEQIQNRLQGAASLQWKGKPAVVAASIKRESDGTLHFVFPCAGGGLSLEDKEVGFQLRTGPLELKTKFVLKEMIYRGKLAL